MSSSSLNVQLAAPAPETIFALSRQGHIEGAAKRELLDRQRAEQLLHPLLQKPPTEQAQNIIKLVLGGKSFGSESAPVLAQALQSTPRLVHADFADCIASRPTDEALDTLQQLCDAIAANEKIQLTHLDLSDNALGVRGIPKIKNAFKNQSNLLHLYFNNDGLQAEAVTALTKLIMENYASAKDGEAEPTTQLRTFEIGHNCLEDAGFLALIPLVRASPLLQTLRIATTRVRNNQGAGLAMARTLRGLHHLTSLSLNDNNLGLEAGLELAKVIDTNKSHLAFLNLGDIGVEEEGVEAIMDSIAHIKPGVLTHLDLSANELTGKHASKLVRIVRSQRESLEHLKLEDNELRSSGASKLFRALSSCPRLTYLNLTNNHLGDRCAKDLLSFLQSAGPQLREIHLNGNRFTEGTLQSIKDVMEQHAKEEGALATMSDNDADEEESEEDEAEEEEEEEEEEAAPAAAAAAAPATAEADKEIDALAADLAATSVSK